MANNSDDLIIELIFNIKNFDKNLKKASRDASYFTNEVKTRFDKLKDSISPIGRMLVGAFSVVAINSARKEFSAFEYQMARVNTILRLSDEELEKLSNQARKAAVAVGKKPEGFAEAMYEAVSAGVELERVIDYTTTAGKLATAGFTEVKTSVDLLTTVENAYGDAIGDVNEISNILLNTQDRGKTTIGKMAAVLGRTIPLAASLGVEFEVLTGAVATMTAQGTNTAESITGLKALLAALSTPSEQQKEVYEQIGVAWSEARLKGEGLADFLSELIEKSNGSIEVLTNLGLSEEALTAALALGGKGFEKFTANIDANRNALGTMKESFDEMTDTSSFKIDKMMAKISNLKIIFGGFISESIIPATDHISNLIEAFTGLDTSTQKLISSLTLLTSITIIGSPFISSLVNLLGLLKALSVVIASRLVPAMFSFLGSLGPIGITLGIIGTAIGIASLAFRDYSNSVEIAISRTKEFERIQQEAADQQAAINASYNEFIEMIEDLVPANNEAKEAIQAQINKIIPLKKELDGLLELKKRMASQEIFLPGELPEGISSLDGLNRFIDSRELLIKNHYSKIQKISRVYENEAKIANQLSAEEIKEQERLLAELKVANIRNEYDRKRAEVDLWYNELVEKTKGNNEILVELEKQKAMKIAEINKQETENKKKQKEEELNQERLKMQERIQLWHEHNSAVIAGYDQFWSSLSNFDMTGSQRQKAILNSMTQAFLRYLGDTIKEYLIAENIKRAESTTTTGIINANNISQMLSGIKEAGASILSAVAKAIKAVAGIPFAGVALGAAAGASIMALFSSTKLALGFDRGGILNPDDGPGYFEARRKEIIAPEKDFIQVFKEYTATILNPTKVIQEVFSRPVALPAMAASTAGSNVTTNINTTIQAWDGADVERVSKKKLVPKIRKVSERGIR